MRITRLLALVTLGTLGAVAACGGTGDPLTGGSSKAGAGGSSAGKGGSAGTSAAGTSNAGGEQGGSAPGAGMGGAAGTIDLGGGSGGFVPGSPCEAGPDEDKDKDGWTISQGDCNDCDANVNPGAIDVVNYAKLDNGEQGEPLPADKQVDEDCDGPKAMPGDKVSCDAGLGAEIKDPFDAARAMGLCNVKVEDGPKGKWGVIGATFSDISDKALGGNIKAKGQALTDAFGILPDFGKYTEPREGERLFALSSGLARAEGDAGYNASKVCSYSKGYTSGFPPGFPKQGSCGTTGAPNDGVALDLKIRVPSNAKSLKFNFRFFSCEYPRYACQVFNDVFAVLMNPSPLPKGDPMVDASGQLANIAFEVDKNNKKNVIGVNNQTFFTACEPSPQAPGYINCKPGNGKELEGSGFDQGDGGGSAWLGTQVPVPSGGIIYLRFAIWDSQDGILDSTAVVDNFQWSAEEGTGVVTKIDPPIGIKSPIELP